MRRVKAWVGAAVMAGASAAFAQCPPPGQSLATLQAIKSAKWEVSSPEARQKIALDLLPCLADANPVLRDEIAFEGLQAWMRKGLVDAATLRSIRTKLLADLASPADAQGFRQPFAALVLAEVARVDRQNGFLTPAERDEMVQSAAAYLSGVRDYRGFDARDGWRHGVAHGADFVLQLSLNPLLQRKQVDVLLDAIASQVMAAGDHFYRHGEGERLMAPVFYLARSGWLQAEEWDRWFAALVSKMPKQQPQSMNALAAKHNLTMFLQALYVSVRESGDGKIEAAVLPGLKKAVRAVE